MRVLDVISNGNSGSSPRVINVCDDVETWQRELLVFNLLQEHDV